MKDSKIKLCAVLLLLLFLDLARPLHYLITCEFLFLGIIYICLYKPLSVSFGLCVVFGFLKDCFSLGVLHFTFLEFALLALLVHLCISRFIFVNKRIYTLIVRLLIPLAAIILHALFNSFRLGIFVFGYCFQFCLQSLLFFYVLQRLLKTWITIEQPKMAY